ncbi:MAG: branched-chain amino acid transport system ATP-binding protein [Colwellia sp.]|jgi:branched-chain amino acid transport system ATP-binding protein
MKQLRILNLISKYGDFQALYGVDVEFNGGETIAIIGSNGAGKSTLLKSIAGLLKNEKSSIKYGDISIGDMPASDILKLGIALVPEGRRLFPSLSVEENLQLGAYVKRKGPWNIEKVYSLFPILKDKKDNPSTALSGGQQQMVAIGRALMSNPDVILFDEISLGLAPTTVKDIYDSFPEIKSFGTTLVVVEQDINLALSVADRIYCFQEGRVSLEGKPHELERESIKAAYFGV